MKVAWFGHKAKERGDDLFTHSKEIVFDEVLGRERVDVAHASLSRISAMTSPSLGLACLGASAWAGGHPYRGHFAFSL